MKLDLSLLAPSEHIVCAVSGGADSMALLWWLFLNRKELSITVSAAHFNHCLRGAESQRDERFVRDFCDKHGIKLIVGSGDVQAFAAAHAQSIEEAARHLRYAFLHTLDCDKIAVAHNAQDNAETVLQNMLRGSGLRGLCGIPPKRGKIIRPLLGVSREQIEAFLVQNGISWVQDSTNQNDAHTRNRIRHEMIPLFLHENPSFLHTMQSQSKILRAEDALLDGYAQELLDCAADGQRYRCGVLLSAPNALQKRALRLLVRQKLPQDVASVHIEQMQKLLSNPSPSAQISLPNGLVFRRYYDCFALENEKMTQSFAPQALSLDAKAVFLPNGWKISCNITENLQIFANSPFHFAVKYDMITQHGITVRSRQSGDVLTLSCRKSLKKWLIEKKIPLCERDELPVFVTAEQVLAVAGLGVDRDFCAQAGEKSVIICVEKLPSDGEFI